MIDIDELKQIDISCECDDEEYRCDVCLTRLLRITVEKTRNQCANIVDNVKTKNHQFRLSLKRIADKIRSIKIE